MCEVRNFLLCFLILVPNVTDRWRCVDSKCKNAQTNIRRSRWITAHWGFIFHSVMLSKCEKRKRFVRFENCMVILRILTVWDKHRLLQHLVLKQRILKSFRLYLLISCVNNFNRCRRLIGYSILNTVSPF